MYDILSCWYGCILSIVPLELTTLQTMFAISMYEMQCMAMDMKCNSMYGYLPLTSFSMPSQFVCIYIYIYIYKTLFL